MPGPSRALSSSTLATSAGAVSVTAMKRIFLFVVTNLAIVLVLSIVAQVTGLDAWLTQQGGSL
jgi:hypothetical protein